MIPPVQKRPSDVPDFTEAAPSVFAKRRKADALPRLAEPEVESPWAGLVVVIVAGALIFTGLVLAVWGVPLLLGWLG
jgi:hypothetical protein